MATFSMPAMLDIVATAAAGTPGCKGNRDVGEHPKHPWNGLAGRTEPWIRTLRCLAKACPTLSMLWWRWRCRRAWRSSDLARVDKVWRWRTAEALAGSTLAELDLITHRSPATSANAHNRQQQTATKQRWSVCRQTGPQERAAEQQPPNPSCFLACHGLGNNARIPASLVHNLVLGPIKSADFAPWRRDAALLSLDLIYLLVRVVQPHQGSRRLQNNGTCSCICSGPCPGAACCQPRSRVFLGSVLKSAVSSCAS